MRARQSQPHLLRLASQFPAVLVSGPRQSGKTTLVRSCFPQHTYLNLEDLDTRELALGDPRGLLNKLGPMLVIDEAQRVPSLWNYLQVEIDRDRRPGRFILTGSQTLPLGQNASQSLAGRVGFLDLLPMSLQESGLCSAAAAVDDAILRGGYPQVVLAEVEGALWFEGYVRTYIERDLRQLSNVRDLAQFQRFMRMMALRTGQLLNLNALASDLGLAQTTVHQWVSILEASFIGFRLPPYFENLGKRLVKTPKWYFHDPGLASWLVGITDRDTLRDHPMRGALFENLMIVDYLKWCRNKGLANRLSFWRDQSGLEVDLLIEKAGSLSAVEFKSGATFQPEWLRSIVRWEALLPAHRRSPSMLISDSPYFAWSSGVGLVPWRQAAAMLE